jgi:four helix bundle protein
MNHKDLAVWKESIKLVKEVYLLLKGFPSYEQFGICSQMRRAAVSIPSNIAEGAGRNNDKELVRFCYIAQGSLAELETQLIISEELGYFKSDNNIFNQLSTVRKILSGYITYLNNKLKKQSTSKP